MIELLAGLAAGPAFLALLGPAGTGKTWLLQAVTNALCQRGQPAFLVPRGELRIEVAAGTTVLVDEAARMDDEKLAQLASIRNASIVLADLPAFESRLRKLARPPAIVPLAPLLPEDMPSFAAAWLASRGVPAKALDGRAATRLFGHSGGVPRLVVQLLRAALAMGGPVGATGIGVDQVDEVAALRLGGFDTGIAAAVQETPAFPDWNLAPAGLPASGPAPAETPVAPGAVPPASVPAASARPRARLGRAGQVAVLPALAASLLVAAVFAGGHVEFPFRSGGEHPAEFRTGLPDVGAIPASGARPIVGVPGAQPPSVQERLDHGTLEPPREDFAEAPPGSESQVVAPPEGSLVTAPPVPQAMEAPPALEPGQAASTDVAQHSDKPADTPSTVVAALPRPMPPSAVPPAAEVPPAPLPVAPDNGRLGQLGGGAPGLVLVMHAGDTMPALYTRVYRGVRPPPYADVVAANHAPIRPGGIVVFPAPLDGWLQH